ncbi:MAG: hypothetical protein HQL55_19470 [Magnetococcales bacterium]|nr:hypothetical protein [Magnetococcales bacterium]
MKNQQVTDSSISDTATFVTTPEIREFQSRRRQLLEKFGKAAIYTPPVALVMWSFINKAYAS